MVKLRRSGDISRVGSDVSMAHRLIALRHRYKRGEDYNLLRIYGRYIDKNGEAKGFGFQWKVSDRISGKTQHAMLKKVCCTLKYKRLMPAHVKNQTFPSFIGLMRQPFFKFKKLIDYKAKS